MGYYHTMTKQRREAIYAFSDRIRASFQLNVPVNLSNFIQNILSGKITEDELEEDISGKIEKHEDSFKITLNSLHPRTRKNFTLAHELGHLFLHMGFMIDPEKWALIDEYIDSPYYRIGYSEEEYDANHFAGALLMPKEEYRKFVTENKNDDDTIDISKISSHFDVSDDAALTRGKWLGIFKWQ